MEIEYITEQDEYIYFNVWVTNDCNLQCKYCYEGEKIKNSNMSETVADKAVEMIIDKYERNHKDAIWVNFHGGEPMLNSSIIKYIVKKIREKKGDGKLYTSTTTNCLIYDEEILNYISELTVSIDGKKKTHDSNRVFFDGVGSYDYVINNALKYREKCSNLRLRMVVSPNNVQELSDNVFYLHSMGFKVIIPGVDFFDRNWTEESFAELLIQMQRIKEIRELKKFSDITIGIIDEQFNEKGKCSVGCDGYQIASDGKLYPCTYVVNNNNYCIGNVFEGLDERAVSCFNDLNQNDVEQCKDCSYYKYCDTSRCLVLNELLTGDCFTASPNICAYQNMRLKLWGYI